MQGHDAVPGFAHHKNEKQRAVSELNNIAIKHCYVFSDETRGLDW
jgi:hypothetical protein